MTYYLWTHDYPAWVQKEKYAAHYFLSTSFYSNMLHCHELGLVPENFYLVCCSIFIWVFVWIKKQDESTSTDLFGIDIYRRRDRRWLRK